AITTRKEAQNICSHLPWKICRKTRMLPIAPSKPITAYNTAITSPPTNWLLDPAPIIRLCSSAESNFCSNSMPSGYRAGAPSKRTLENHDQEYQFRIHHIPHVFGAPPPSLLYSLVAHGGFSLGSQPMESSVTAVLVAGEATERRVDPPPCFARAW